MVNEMNVVPVLLLPLVTPTEFTEAEKVGMDPLLWMQGTPPPSPPCAVPLTLCCALLTHPLTIRCAPDLVLCPAHPSPDHLTMPCVLCTHPLTMCCALHTHPMTCCPLTTHSS